MMKKFFLFIIVAVMVIFQQTADCNSPVNRKPNNAFISETEIRENIVAFAMNYLGTPYKYASIDPEKGFDCSGFVHFVFKNFDINLPHSSKAFKSVGNQLKPEEFKIGDVLVFYGYRNTSQIGHVGIICEANGMNSKFIHSSSGKVKGVIISELNSAMYSKRFYRCVDVLGKE